jgi:hypothetical protein
MLGEPSTLAAGPQRKGFARGNPINLNQAARRYRVSVILPVWDGNFFPKFGVIEVRQRKLPQLVKFTRTFLQVSNAVV